MRVLSIICLVFICFSFKIAGQVKSIASPKLITCVSGSDVNVQPLSDVAMLNITEDGENVVIVFLVEMVLDDFIVDNLVTGDIENDLTNGVTVQVGNENEPAIKNIENENWSAWYYLLGNFPGGLVQVSIDCTSPYRGRAFAYAFENVNQEDPLGELNLNILDITIQAQAIPQSSITFSNPSQGDGLLDALVFPSPPPTLDAVAQSGFLNHCTDATPECGQEVISPMASCTYSTSYKSSFINAVGGEQELCWDIHADPAFNNHLIQHVGVQIRLAPNFIPTLSEWGFIIMMLMLMIFGVVGLSQRIAVQE